MKYKFTIFYCKSKEKESGAVIYFTVKTKTVALK
jgi:hypothetical protein